NFSQERGFNWADFERDVERAVSDQRWVRQVKDELKDAEFDFVTDSGERVPLNPKMLVVLDEGLTLANQQGQAQCSSAHALAIIAGLGTRSDLALKKRGITQKSVLEAINQASLMVSSGAPTKN